MTLRCMSLVHSAATAFWGIGGFEASQEAGSARSACFILLCCFYFHSTWPDGFCSPLSSLSISLSLAKPLGKALGPPFWLWKWLNELDTFMDYDCWKMLNIQGPYPSKRISIPKPWISYTQHTDRITLYWFKCNQYYYWYWPQAQNLRYGMTVFWPGTQWWK